MNRNTSPRGSLHGGCGCGRTAPPRHPGQMRHLPAYPDRISHRTYDRECKDHHAVKGGKAVRRFQCTVIAVAGHRVGPQRGVQGQSLFQIAQAVAQKDQGVDAFASVISTRSMAARPPWLSLKIRSFVTKGSSSNFIHQPAGPVARYQQLLVHFALGIRGALCRRLGGGGGAKALPGQLQCPLRCLLQRQLLLRLCEPAHRPSPAHTRPAARWPCSAPPPRRGWSSRSPRGAWSAPGTG